MCVFFVCFLFLFFFLLLFGPASSLVHRFTTSSLPLPRDGAAKANAFDYVVLLVNMLDGLSIDVAGGAMAHLQHETIFGQCCIVCTHGSPGQN